MIPIPVLILLLMLLGLILIVLEAIVPFGISMIIGGAVIAFSVYLCFETYGPAAGVLYSLVAGSLALTAVYIILRQGVTILSLRPPAPDPTASQPAEETPWPADGEVVEVVQPLRPTGTVEWSDQRYPARLLSPEHTVEVGRRVRIEGRDSIYLLVEAAEEPRDPASQG